MSSYRTREGGFQRAEVGVSALLVVFSGLLDTTGAIFFIIAAAINNDATLNNIGAAFFMAGSSFIAVSCLMNISRTVRAHYNPTLRYRHVNFAGRLSTWTILVDGFSFLGATLFIVGYSLLFGRPSVNPIIAICFWIAGSGCFLAGTGVQAKLLFWEDWIITTSSIHTSMHQIK